MSDASFALQQAWGSKTLQPGLGKPESKQVSSTSNRSNFTAQKKLVEDYGLASCDNEAIKVQATAHFLSRLSAQSVNDTDIAVLAEPQVPDFRFWNSKAPRTPSDNSPSKADARPIEPLLDVSKFRDVSHTEANTPLASFFETSTANTAESGLAVLAAATAKFEAIESIVDLLRAACSSPDSRKKKHSAAYIRRRDRIRNRRFEQSSFCPKLRGQNIKR